MAEKSVFWCGSCGAKLVTDRHGIRYLRRSTDTWYGKPTGAVTADCFCGGTMTAYENGAFVDGIEKATGEFERVIETAYEAAREAVCCKRNHN